MCDLKINRFHKKIEESVGTLLVHALPPPSLVVLLTVTDLSELVFNSHHTRVLWPSS